MSVSHLCVHWAAPSQARRQTVRGEGESWGGCGCLGAGRGWYAEPGSMLYGNEDIASIPSIKPSYLVSMIPAMAPPPSPGSWLPWSSVPVCRAGRGGAGRPQWRCSRGLVPPRHSAADSQYSGLQHPANTAFIPHTAPGRHSLHCLLDLQYLQ